MRVLAFTILSLSSPPSLPPGFATTPDGLPLSEAHLNHMRTGEVLTHLAEVGDHPVKQAIAMGLIDTAAEDVFAVITDYDRGQRAYVTSMKVVSRTPPNKVRVAFELDLPWPVGDRHYALDIEDTADTAGPVTTYRSRWTYVPGSGNIEDTFGTFEIAPLSPEESLVRYTVYTDPGGYLPLWARNVGARISLRKVIHAVAVRARAREQQRAESPK